MSGGIRHAYSGELYEPDGDGGIFVRAVDGRTGRFRSDGRWIEGDVREADPALCCWVAGPRTVSNRTGAVISDS